ncbi:MAG TPA: choice-of-anchor D domain-containing protein [Ignavibacteria bacterium]|nr:choice-of-anchor D domain-containing protein [Ignavibacteria bacterium]
MKTILYLFSAFLLIGFSFIDKDKDKDNDKDGIQQKNIEYLSVSESNTESILYDSYVTTTSVPYFFGAYSILDSPKEESQGNRDNPYGASEYRYKMVTGELKGVDPIAARMEAVKYTEDRMSSYNSLRDNAQTLNWSAKGPGNIGGRIRSILVKPGNSNLMLIGSVSGGIWKSTDGGTTWLPKLDAGNPMCINTMITDPNNSNIVFAGTGEGWLNYDAVYGGGIYRSTNFGDTWILLPLTVGTEISKFRNIMKLAFDNAGNLYASTFDFNVTGGVGNSSTNGGLYKSTNSGLTWSNNIGPNTFGSNFFRPCDMLAINSSTYLYATSPNGAILGGIYRTSNSGNNWTKMTIGLPTAGYSRIALTSSTNNTAIYAAISSTNLGAPEYGLKGIYKSEDYGATWYAVGTPPLLASTGGMSYLGAQGDYDNVIAVDPYNSSILYAGGVEMIKSTNGGTNWFQLTYWHPSFGSPVVHADHHAITFDLDFLDKFYCGNDGGIYRTTNGGTSWTSLNNGLQITQFYGGAVYPTGNTFFGGTQDNGHLKYTSGTSWTESVGGDGGYAAQNQTNNLISYEEYVYLLMSKTTDGGASWFGCTNGLTDAGNSGYTLFISPFSMNPQNSNVLIAASDKVWVTDNAAGSWAQSSNQLATGYKISAVTITANTPGNYRGYAGSANGRIFKCTSLNPAAGIDAWTEITPAGNNSAWVRRIVENPYEPNKIYACYSGYNVGGTLNSRHVYYSTNQGTNWTDVSLSLPNVPVHTLVVNPVNTSEWFIGTETGVYNTTNLGANWNSFNTGMPSYVPVDELVLQKGTDKLVAFSHGRSVWEVKLDAPAIEVYNLNGVLIPDGKTAVQLSDSTDFGQVSIGTNKVRTFEIRNTGSLSLNIQQILISGSPRFTVSALSPPSPIPPAGSAYFNITYSPIAAGTDTATVIINSDDPNESPYDFRIGGGSVASPGEALSFDGVNDYVALPNSLTAAASGGTEITIEYWFKGSSLQSAVRLQDLSGNYIIAGWNNMHIISTDGGTANGIPIGNGSTDGNWHHIAMSWIRGSGGGFKSYVDGNLVFQRTSASVNLPNIASGGFLGCYQGSSEFTNGSLDNVRIWKRALPQSEIQAYRFCDFNDQRTGLVAHYKFNQGFGNIANPGVTSLTDISGNNYTGTLNNFALTGLTSNWIYPGAVNPSNACANAAASLKFDGIDDRITLVNSLTTAATGGTAITIEYWFKGSNITSAVRFQPTGSDYIVAGWQNLHIISTDGGLNGISVGAGATDGNWHHIAMTWQKNTVNGFRSYLDGNLVAQRNSANVNLPALTSGGYLGSNLGTSEFMNGSLDNVRIWNRALSQAELQNNKNCEIPSSATGLLANYKFNQGIDAGNNAGQGTLLDASGNNYYGFLTGFGLSGTNSNWLAPGGVVSGTACPPYNPAPPCEDFTSTTFPPSSFNIEFTGSNLWSRQTESAYGIGSGSAKFNFYNANANQHQSLVSDEFLVTGSNSYLTFDEAYAPYNDPFFGPDTLLVEASNNSGVSYTVLATLTGRIDGTGELNTAPPDPNPYVPENSEWRPKIYSLPSGTNKIRLQAKSGWGNNLYLDNICVQTLPAPTTYTVGAIPQGFYRGVPGPYDVVRDTVRIYLHRMDFPNIIVDSAVSFSEQDGFCNSVMTRALSGSYYFAVKHRNSIETWSSFAANYIRGTYFLFDMAYFNYAYGGNQFLTATANYWAMFGGDVDQNGFVDLNDVTSVNNDANFFASGYVVTDVTGDNAVNLSDVLLTYNNNAAFVAKQTPPGASPAPNVNPDNINNKKPVFENDAQRQKYEAGREYLKQKKAEVKEYVPNWSPMPSKEYLDKFYESRRKTENAGRETRDARR